MRKVIKHTWAKVLALTSMLAGISGLTACTNSDGEGFGYTFEVNREITGGQAALIAVGIVVVAVIIFVIVKFVQKRK